MNVSSSNQEQYLYDASSTRVLRRSTNSTSTSLTVYAFGQEEHSYTSTGSNQGNTYYYTLAGNLVGKSDGVSTSFYQTDTLGSVVADLSNTAVLGNEVYGPYGKQRYNQGTHGTAKGFTGQYTDGLTGLDYHTARYYDPKAGVFLSADTVQGNVQGLDPYSYVGGNPETKNDPTGQYFVGEEQKIGSYTAPQNAWRTNDGGLKVVQYYGAYGPPIWNQYTPAEINRYDPYWTGPTVWQKIKDGLGITNIQHTFKDPHASGWDKVGAVAGAVINDVGNLVLAGSFLFGGLGFAVRKRNLSEERRR